MTTEKKVVIEFLKKSGFTEKGTDQYFHEDFGRLFLNNYDPKFVFQAIMDLGKKHQGKAIRDLLFVEEAYRFQPQATEPEF